MEEKKKFDSTAYKRGFNEKAYDRISVTIPKGQKTHVEAFAGEKGYSVNGIINVLLQREMGLTDEQWRKPESGAGE